MIPDIVRKLSNQINHFETPSPHSVSCTLQKVIPTRPRMGDHPLISPISRENHSIRPRTTSSIHLLITQDRKLIIRPCIWESETLIVFVLVWILVAADGLVVFIVIIALLDGGGDVGRRVAGCAAGFGTLAGLEEGVAEGERRQAEGEEEEKLEEISTC